MKKTIRTIIFIICLVVLIFSSYKMIDYYMEEHESTSLIDDTKFEYTSPTDAGLININFPALCAQYPDVAAWLYQPGTNINYPVVQSADNDHYLRRLLDGSHNMNGTLFVDYRCARDFSDSLTVIYGHNMKNGEMFATFPNYATQEYFDAHPYMMLYTPDGDYKISLFAGYLTDDTDMVYALFNDGGPNSEEIFQYAQGMSIFKSDITEYSGENLVILSTCSYEKSNSRFVLVGILEPQ
ncbi:MAG: class B sortase [Clostridia bacterium]|nr:class B sortase [Clostridia bacterium]